MITSKGHMRTCLSSFITPIFLSLALTAAPAKENKTGKSPYCAEYDKVSQSLVPCGTLGKSSSKKLTRVKNPNYCTEYDKVSQSLVPCVTQGLRNIGKTRALKKPTNYCTEYDIVSQSLVPCETMPKNSKGNGR